MITSKDVNIFIENKVVQDATDGDWTKVDSTVLKYKPKEINIKSSESSSTSIVSYTDIIVDGVPIVAVDGGDVVSGNVDSVVKDTLNTITEVNQLTASDAQDSDHFGVSVALSSDGLIAIVGAHYEDTAATDAGKVYTYKRATIDDSWIEVSQLTASDAQASDKFGASVALSSDGLIAMVGAFLEDTIDTDTGKVYTYKRATIDDAWTEVNTLTASDAQASDSFGSGVALSSDGLIAIVGAYAEDTAATDAGKVYTYKRATIDDAWTEVNQLTASDAQAYDYFGVSVALSSDGLIAMVGAYAEDTAATDAGKVYTYKRATIDDTWIEVNQLTASDAQAYNNFGVSVALSSDGLIAMVGAWGSDTAATDAGKVYTYKRSTIDDTWTEVSQLTASDAQASDNFGVSVALSSGGLIAMVGAHYEDTIATDAGKVYTYNLAFDRYTADITSLNLTNTPTSIFKDSYAEVTISLEPTEDELFMSKNILKVVLDATTATDGTNIVTTTTLVTGEYIGIDGKYLPLGTVTYDSTSGLYTADISSFGLTKKPNVVYKKRGLFLSKTTSTTTEYVGDSSIVNLVSVGDQVLLDTDVVDVTAVSTTLNGPDFNTITEVNQLTASDAQASDNFGGSIALSSDGLIAMVGAYSEDTIDTNTGKVYTYKRSTIDDPWIEVSQLTASDAQASDYFGRSVALSSDGLIAMVGDGYKTTGRVAQAYTYKRTTIDDPWVEVSIMSNPTSSDIADIFGGAIALSGDGLVCVVSANANDDVANNAGKVYTYKRATIDDAWTYLNELICSNAISSGYFGGSLAMSSDGLVLSVGHDDTGDVSISSNKVYTYKRATIDDTWTEVNQLTASDAQAGDNFGRSVALSSDGLIAMVGAYLEDTAAADAGKVYTYKRATIDDTWIEVNQLTASDAQASDGFGESAALSSDGLIAMVGAHFEDTAATDAGKVYTYKMKQLLQYTIDYADIGYATNSLMVYSKDILPDILSLTYNTSDNCLEKLYDATTTTGRVIQRAINTLDKDVEILTPLTTNTYTN